MPATIATRDNDAVLGPRKDQLGGPGPRTKTINADEWNRVVDLLFAMQAEIGDTDGTTVDSLWEAVGGGGGGGGFSYVSVTADATLPSSNAIVDVDTSGLTAPDTLELQLPAAAAGRMYFVRKAKGAADETITLKRAASEEINNTAANLLLPGSEEYVSDDAPYMWPVWMVTCNGTDWLANLISQQVLHTKGTGSPTADEVTGYMPGSTWCDTVQSPGSKLYMQMGTDAGSADWMRVDAMDVSEVAFADSPYTLSTRDRQVDVDTSGGAVVLAHPGAAASGTGQTVGVQHVVMKTNAGTSKVSLSFGSSTSVNGAAGVTSYDLPGSDTASQGLWRITIRDGVVWVSGGAGLSTSSSGGALFTLNTAVTTDLESTTEVQGKTGPSGSAFAGTVTVTGNVASPWDSATKILTLTTSAGMEGLGLRRVLCGTLPAAGFVVDLGIADLGSLLTTRLVLAFYEQRAGTNGRGIGLSFLYNDATLYMTGFGDDGIDSPAVNTSPLSFDSTTGGFASAPFEFDRGPVRVIVEFRKVDASSPERWTIRARLEGHAGSVQSLCYSGIYAPSSAWSTALDVAGVTMSRLALGAWCTSAAGGALGVSHLRVYPLGAAIPT